jgi:hypothetical protein
MKMTAYPSVRKPARNTPEPIELEFARDRPARSVVTARAPIVRVRAQRHERRDLPIPGPRREPTACESAGDCGESRRERQCAPRVSTACFTKRGSAPARVDAAAARHSGLLRFSAIEENMMLKLTRRAGAASLGSAARAAAGGRYAIGCRRRLRGVRAALHAARSRCDCDDDAAAAGGSAWRCSHIVNTGEE